MPTPITTFDVASLLKKTRLLSDPQIEEYLASHTRLETPEAVIESMKTDGLLTPFQADQILKGRHKGFILGKYKLLDRIGMGGMGQVYLAEHMTMRRRVAVKVLPPNRSDNPYARERFMREARAAALLEHPNLVRAHDLETDGEVTYLVMDYIEGTTLHDLVRRRGPQPIGRIAHFLKMTCAGLQAVHERMLVHRDIKPANLLLDRSGVVRLVDLGLVRSELDDDALTRGEGARVVGTADYLAPEQAMHSSNVDGRADLYSVGCTAYYLLTGEPPFKAEKLSQKLIAHQVQDVKPPHEVRPGIPLEFSGLVMRLLAKRPEDRFRTAAEVIVALGPWTREPCAPPGAEDFPNKNEAVYGPTALGLSLSSRFNYTDMSGTLRRKTPGEFGASSDIRRAQDQPISGLSQANQKTAPMAEGDTLRDAPKPGLPGDQEVPLVRVENPITDSRLAALFGTEQPAYGYGMSGSIWAAAGLGFILLLVGLAVLILRN